MKSRVTIICLAPFCMFATSFAGEQKCPEGNDFLQSGIVVAYADGTEVTYAPSGPQPGRVIEVSRLQSPDEGFWHESWLGVYPLIDGFLKSDQPDRSYISTSIYPVPVEELPIPMPGKSWAGQVEEVDSLGKSLGSIGLKVTFEGRRTFRIGECAYDAFQIETLYTDAEGGFQATLDYLPELGFSIQTAGGALGTLLQFYHPIKIRSAQTGWTTQSSNE